MSAKFIGIGVGPGDPELITLKALHAIQSADVISYLSNENGHSQARDIVSQFITNNADQRELAIAMPMNTDRSLANQAYDNAAVELQHYIDQGKTVVFLCEGDPLFFGSFSYLLARLQGSNQCQIIPGISSVHAASAALANPLTQLTDSFAVVSGRHSSEQLISTLRQHESVVIIKAGRARVKILQALEHANRLGDACYLEHIGRSNQSIARDVTQLERTPGPYFSLFLVLSTNRGSA